MRPLTASYNCNVSYLSQGKWDGAPQMALKQPGNSFFVVGAVGYEFAQLEKGTGPTWFI